MEEAYSWEPRILKHTPDWDNGVGSQRYTDKMKRPKGRNLCCINLLTGEERYFTNATEVAQFAKCAESSARLAARSDYIIFGKYKVEERFNA
ncbi:MAG: hypothetical protein C0436_00255 [Alphaproteobacteria bacterium]|nr:hypothetical protein [Alphaproteobacteria bacterium]